MSATKRRWVRRALAILVGAALAWSCAYWPEGPLRDGCQKVSLLLKALGG